MKRTLILKLAVVLGLLATAVGCMIQPVDSVTGEKVGPAISARDPMPTTNPATGNPVRGEVTDQPDNDAILGVGGLFGPYGSVAAAALVAGLAVYGNEKRKQRKAKE
jgi:hypothetical protein